MTEKDDKRMQILKDPYDPNTMRILKAMSDQYKPFLDGTISDDVELAMANAVLEAFLVPPEPAPDFRPQPYQVGSETPKQQIRQVGPVEYIGHQNRTLQATVHNDGSITVYDQAALGRPDVCMHLLERMRLAGGLERAFRWADQHGEWTYAKHPPIGRQGHPVYCIRLLDAEPKA